MRLVTQPPTELKSASQIFLFLASCTWYSKRVMEPVFQVSVTRGSICKFFPSISPRVHFDLFPPCKFHVRRASLLMQFLLLSRKACLEDRLCCLAVTFNLILNLIATSYSNTKHITSQMPILTLTLLTEVP